MGAKHVLTHTLGSPMTEPMTRLDVVLDANRCLNYDVPCTRACPTSIDIPRLRRRSAAGELAAAHDRSGESDGRQLSPCLPARTGRERVSIPS